MFKLRTFGWRKEPKTSSQGEESAGNEMLLFFFSLILSYSLLPSDFEERKEEKSEKKSLRIVSSNKSHDHNLLGRN